MKKMFCVEKKWIYLVILFLLVILTTLKARSNYFSFKPRAEQTFNVKLCPINLSTMMTNEDCCDDADRSLGYRCYREGYEINCATRKVVKCDCSTETGRCKTSSITTLNTPTPIRKKSPTPTPPSAQQKPSYCDLYGKYSKPNDWQKNCCGQYDISTGRFKCVSSESESGFIKSKVYYQYHCSTGRYWKCTSSCKSTTTCQNIELGPFTSTVSQPSLTPTKTPTPKPTLKNNSTITPVKSSITAIPTLAPAKATIQQLNIDEYELFIKLDNAPSYVTNEYRFIINVNPHRSMCGSYVTLDQTYKYGFLVEIATVKVRQETESLAFYVYDTYGGRKIEILRDSIPFSTFWSIYEDALNITYCVE